MNSSDREQVKFMTCETKKKSFKFIEAVGLSIVTINL